MTETLTNFRQAVSDSTDLQEKVKAGIDLVELGKENGYKFTRDELNDAWKQLRESDEGFTDLLRKHCEARRRVSGWWSYELPSYEKQRRLETNITTVLGKE